MFHENKSSGKGESAVNEPQPLISQQSMLTDQGCCKCTHLRKRFRSARDRSLVTRLPSALCSQSHLRLSPTRLTSSAHPVLSGNTSHACSEEGRSSFSAQVAPRSQRRSSPPAIPTLSFQDTRAFPWCQEVPHHPAFARPPSWPTCICLSICVRALL